MTGSVGDRTAPGAPTGGPKRGNAMALDMFLDLGPVKGESRDKVYAGKIDMLAWSWGVSNSGAAHVGGGIGSGKATFQDISITKYVDLSSSELLKSVSLGTHFPEAKIIVRRAGSDARLEYYSIAMKDVMVTSFQTGGSGADDRLSESVTLIFASVEVKYQAQDARGGESSESTFRFDVSENTPG
jgi:type VI secretion system secreted protein Hcp